MIAPSQAAQLIFPFLMVYAACSDALTLTIANWISLALTASFLTLALIAGLPAPVLLSHFGAGCGVLAAGFALFCAGVIGGGDAKLAAAAALWLGPAQLPGFAFDSALIGGGLAAAVGLFRLSPLPAPLAASLWLNRLHDRAFGLPYGVALAAGALLHFPASQLALRLAAASRW